jgi:predicted dehydrogenase
MLSNMSNKIAVVGCGAAVEKLYVPHLQQKLRDKVSLIFVDQDINRAKLYAKKFSGSYASSITMAYKNGAEGAIIATPHPSHLELAKEALNNQMHVLVEKPATVDAVEAMELVSIAASSEASVSVNHSRRLFPSFGYVKKIIDNKTYGTVKSISMIDGSPFSWPTVSGFYLTSEKAKGVLLDRGSHMLDILCWWLANDEFDILSSSHDGFNGPESNFKLRLKSSSKVNIEYSLSRLFKLKNEIIISMDLVDIRVKLFSWNELEIRKLGGSWKKITLTPDGKKVIEYEEFVGKLVDNFIEVLNGHKKPIAGIEDVLPSISLISRAYEMAKPFELEWYSDWVDNG